MSDKMSHGHQLGYGVWWGTKRLRACQRANLLDQISLYLSYTLDVDFRFCGDKLIYFLTVQFINYFGENRGKGLKYCQQNEQLKWGDILGWVMCPAAFVLSHFLDAVTHGSPTLCARPTLLFLGAKHGCYIIFFSAEQVAQVAPGPFTLPPCRNWTGRGPGRALSVLTSYGTPICWGWVRMATHEQLPLYQRKLAARCETSAANLA